jgi:tRNA(adenine34) deaminase
MRRVFRKERHEPTLDEKHMDAALREARRAVEFGDVPVGALVVDADGKVLASAHNEREARSDPTAHAEILALRRAAAETKSWRLEGCTVYVSLEPCPMCAGALVAARVRRLVYGAADPKAGAALSLYNICADPRLNHEVDVVWGVREEESSALLSDFFRERRAPEAE